MKKLIIYLNSIGGIIGLAITLGSQTVDAKTVPTALRGNWYNLAPASETGTSHATMWGYHYRKHSLTITSGHQSQTMTTKHMGITKWKTRIRFQGGHWQTATAYTAGWGDMPSFIPASGIFHGKRHRMLLCIPQNGNWFDVYTHFKPKVHWELKIAMKN
ncbi:hypothetical protein [Lentilactobacillus hilgardii]|uniref:hypothetical protein n=1 Tax=Lentilactobacillus hilgardii TaxID=1588 RepID=UPI0039EA88A6